MLAALELCGGNEAISRFRISPKRSDNLYEIPAGGHQPISFTFNFDNITPSTDYSVVVTIDTNAPHETLTVALKVERPPIALILPSRTALAVLVYGDHAVLPVTVRNQGGGMLKITGVQIDEPQPAANLVL